MNLQRSSLKVLFSRTGGAVLSFVSIVIFARELSAAELGIFFLYQMLISFLSIPGSFGRGTAIIKRLSAGDDPASILSTSIAFLVASSGVLVVFILAVSSHINQYVGAEVAGLVAVGIVLRSLYTLPINVLKGELRVGEAATLNFLQKLIWLLLSFAMIGAGYGYEGLIFGLLVSYFLAFVLAARKVSTPLGNISTDAAKSLFDYWKFTIFSFLDSTIYSWADIAIIGLLLTQTEVGIYEVAWRLTTVVILASAAIESIILPQISSWDASGSREKIEDLFPGAIFGALFLAIPAFFGTLVLSEQLLTFLFGEEYAAGGLVLLILMFSKLIESVDRIIKNFLEGIDLPNLRMRAVLLSIVLNLVLNLTLVWFYGVAGAAVATTVAFATSTIVTLYYLSSHVKLHVPVWKLGWSLVASVGMLGMLLTISHRIAIDTDLKLLVLIAVGVVVYLGIALIYSPIRETAKYNLSSALDQ